MTKLDQIIAVKDNEASAKWYQNIFELRNNHGGDHFSVLVSDDDEVILCLHKGEEHNHPTMTDPGITPGYVLMLYFRTENMLNIYQNSIAAGCGIEEYLHLNPNY